MLAGFTAQRIRIGESELYVRTGGSGPPLLLLHGYPQTGAMWHQVAPQLAARFSLVIPDLPGYGRSIGPPCDAAHEAYSKRTTARTMADLMRHLGHDRFRLAGHDRGGRVAFRLCLDHPDRVEQFAALDIIPTLDQWERLTADRALGGYHWQFLAVPAPVPEMLIGSHPDFYLDHLLRRWAGNYDALSEGSLDDYREAFRKPEVIHATCNDYRAGAGIDRQHDQASRDAGEKIRCPVHVIWGRGYLSNRSGSPLPVWQQWADAVGETGLACGHFVAEELPNECAAAMLAFFQ
ncbi:MAG: alpha/beta hydrolase [Alphaproteobacteria bacterium]|nr:alpha/beta hydrolase [Alphaproteobacteria bacterium]MCB9929791.1 alpha/beta hydrolase [Alphaproteobacteria bacterium]